LGLDGIRNDLKIAKDYLYKHQAKIVAVKDGIILGEEQGMGIDPFLKLIESIKDNLIGSSIADRVIGHASAVLVIKEGVAAAYGEMLSEEAEKRLQQAGIVVEGGIKVPYILRRDKKGRCPMDAAIYNVPDNQEAAGALFEFLRQRNNSGA
jgi:hypothetical protein